MTKAEEMIRDYKLKYETDEYVVVRPVWLKRTNNCSALAVLGALFLGVLYAGFRRK